MYTAGCYDQVFNTLMSCSAKLHVVAASARAEHLTVCPTRSTIRGPKSTATMNPPISGPDGLVYGVRNRRGFWVG